MNALEAVHRFETFRRLLMRYGYDVDLRSTFRNANVGLPGGRILADPDPYAFEDTPPKPVRIVFQDDRGERRSVEDLGDDAFLDFIRAQSARKW